MLYSSIFQIVNAIWNILQKLEEENKFVLFSWKLSAAYFLQGIDIYF